MAVYPRLAQLATVASGARADAAYRHRVIPYLIDVWLNNYRPLPGGSDIVTTSVDGFGFLFDVAGERLLAAWGISRGRHAGARDRARMAGHPLSAGALYHRGHAIPHTLGGPLDINLVPQRGAVNIGPFRALEKRAVATPGSLYFTYWWYGNARGQTPALVDQGLLVPGNPPELRTHGN